MLVGSASYHGQGYDLRYEIKAIMVLALAFGLVGLDRWLVTPLAPQIMKDLELDYQDLGALSAAVGLSWGLFAIIMGRLGDRIGRRAIIIPATLAFSLMSALSGLATGFVSLIFCRFLMGVAEGAYCPTSYAAALDASPPARRGLNLGIISGAFALFGLALGPILATQLVTVLPSWRYVFLLVAAPGLILAYAMHRILRDPPRVVQPHETTPDVAWRAVLSYRNMKAILPLICCSMSGVFVLGAMTPLFLTDVVHLETTTMGFVMSGLGFGGFVGQIGIGWVSDRLGRKLTVALSLATGCAALLALALGGFAVFGLFVALFIAAFSCCGASALLAGPVAGEAVPPNISASAMGLAIGGGEIFGGGVAPAIGGSIAAHFGLVVTMLVVATVLACGTLLTMFLQETAPRFHRQ